MRSAGRDWYQRDVRNLEWTFHRSRTDGVTIHGDGVVGVDAAHEVSLLGHKAFRVELELGWAVVESPDQRGIPRGEQLLVGVPDFFPLGTVVFVGGGVGVILALGR